MSTHYPLKYTLEDGTHVTVNRIDANTFEFNLDPPDGSPSHFTYVQDNRSKTELEESLDFNQLDALRRFWLETEDIV